jgi:hypothetical protein
MNEIGGLELVENIRVSKEISGESLKNETFDRGKDEK